jgi:predicted  nucleic acid-binding Zn-ribbon protein
MAIPQINIPQANIQNAQPLLAQFNAARAAAQGQQMPVIQGRGIDPAQLLQMAQANALQVNNRLDGQANQFIDTDPAKDIRARERYLEQREKSKYDADRLDAREIYSQNRTDARSIYENENAITAADKLYERTKEENDRIYKRGEEAKDRRTREENAEFDRRAKIDSDRLDKQHKLQVELEKVRDQFARQREIDHKAAEQKIREADQDRYGSFYGKELDEIDNYWGTPGNPGKRQEHIDFLQQQFLRQGGALNPTTPEGQKAIAGFEQSQIFKNIQAGMPEGTKATAATPGYLEGLKAWAEQQLENPGSDLGTKFYQTYAKEISLSDAAMHQRYNRLMDEAIRRGVVPVRGGGGNALAPNAAPGGGGVQVQGGIDGGVPIAPGGGANPLQPYVPVAPGDPAPSNMPPPSTTPPPPPEEDEGLTDGEKAGIIGGTGMITALTPELARQVPIDVDQEFAKVKPNQDALDKGIRDTINSGETPVQSKKIQEANQALQKEKDRVGSATQRAQKLINDAKTKISTNQTAIDKNNKKIAKLDKKIEVAQKKYPQVQGEVKKLKEQKKALNQSNQGLMAENKRAQDYISTNEKRIKGFSDYQAGKQRVRNTEVSQIRKDVPKNITRQRVIVENDPTLKETAQRQGKLNAIVSKYGMNPDDFRTKSGLLDEAMVRDHLSKKKEFVIQRVGRMFPKAMSAVWKGLTSRPAKITGGAIFGALSAYGALSMLTESEKKDLELQLDEFDLADEGLKELDGANEPNALNVQP